MAGDDPKGLHIALPSPTVIAAEEGPTKWRTRRHGEVGILTAPNTRALFRDMAIQAAWMELARHRSGYDGLAHGFDYSSTLKKRSTLMHQDSKSRVRSSLQNGVWTPTRAARNAGRSEYLHSGAPNVDVERLWWNCPKIPKIHKIHKIHKI